MLAQRAVQHLHGPLDFCGVGESSGHTGLLESPGAPSYPIPTYNFGKLPFGRPLLILVLRHGRSVDKIPVPGGRSRVREVQASRGQGVKGGDGRRGGGAPGRRGGDFVVAPGGEGGYVDWWGAGE